MPDAQFIFPVSLRRRRSERKNSISATTMTPAMTKTRGVLSSEGFPPRRRFLPAFTIPSPPLKCKSTFSAFPSFSSLLPSPSSSVRSASLSSLPLVSPLSPSSAPSSSFSSSDPNLSTVHSRNLSISGKFSSMYCGPLWIFPWTGPFPHAIQRNQQQQCVRKHQERISRNQSDSRISRLDLRGMSP